MKSSLLALLILEAACASPRAATTAGSARPPERPIPPPPSAACVAARAVRAEAEKLDQDGHESLALAKVAEANAACPAERASTLPIETRILGDLGECAALRALPSDARGVKEALATCASREAAPTGTAASMRAKMREAAAAERAKDWPRAKSLYLAAWGELHPNARAIESAARVAALAGDAAESRRLRDRALVEAEASEHAVAEITERVRVVRGSPYLAGSTLLLGHDGNVVARDLATGELRVLVTGKAGHTRISPGGTLATVAVDSYLGDATTLSVFDLATGELVLKVPNAGAFAVSPDDTRIVVRDRHVENDPLAHARVLDVATGTVVAKVEGDFSNDTMFFGPDAAHVFFYGGAADVAYRQWSVEKRAFTGVKLPSIYAAIATSLNGQYVAYLEQTSDGAPIHVLDLATGKDAAKWTGSFHSVSALAVSNDGASLATGSLSSLRLWDVAKKKQTFKDATGFDSAGTQSSDATQFAFSEDGKTMILAGDGLATTWDVATGTQKEVVSEQPPKKMLGVVPAPDGAALILEDEVRIVPTRGEPRSVCRGMKPAYYDMIGPTAVAFSPSGKSFACAMSDGWVHVFDTSTWAEKSVVKRGAASPAARPVDLVFSADDKTLTVASDKGFIVYDAATAAVSSKLAFRHASVGLAPRHARFDDGSFAVRAWNGAVALFDKDGAFVRDVKLDFGAPIDALDAFASGGSVYAVALHKTLHLVDLATGTSRTVELPSVPKTLAVSRDGKTIVAAGADKTVSVVTAAGVAPLAGARGVRAWMAGNSVLVASSDDTVGVFGLDGKAGPTLEIDPDAVVARQAEAFDLRGKPTEVECVVGKVFLTRETCADRANGALVPTWIQRAVVR